MKHNQKSLDYCFARNDGQPKSSIKLIQFRAIIAKALPNMDKPHIIRLLFDARHQSLIAYDEEGIVGGCCFAPFEKEGFAELAFLAVRAQKRIQGYGKKIMNKFKSVIQGRKLQYIITYGDNMALGFFRKQGFSEKITMPKQLWEGFIKEYDGGKLMECKIHPTVDYININNIIKMQKKHVIEMIKRSSMNATRFQGKLIPKENQEGPFERKLKGDKIQIFHRDPRKIPGIIQSGWEWEEYDFIKKCEMEPFQVRCKKLLESIKRYPEAKYFLEPVSIKQVPNYYEVVKQPMDLKTIGQKLVNRAYKNEDQFCLDIELIFENCKTFNHPESIYYKSAIRLKELVDIEILALRNAMINTQAKIQTEKND